MEVIKKTYLIAEEKLKDAERQYRNDESIEKINTLLDSGTEDDIEKAVEIEMELEAQYNLAELRKLKELAEDALIEWAKRKVKDYPEYQEVEVLFDNYKKYPHIRDKVIDLTLRLDPEK